MKSLCACQTPQKTAMNRRGSGRTSVLQRTRAAKVHSARQRVCGGGVPSSHPSFGLAVFFLFFRFDTGGPSETKRISNAQSSKCPSKLCCVPSPHLFPAGPAINRWGGESVCVRVVALSVGVCTRCRAVWCVFCVCDCDKGPSACINNEAALKNRISFTTPHAFCFRLPTPLLPFFRRYDP